MLVKSVISIQRGLALSVAALASAARRFLGALQYRTIGLPVVFTLAAALVATSELRGGGVHHGPCERRDQGDAVDDFEVTGVTVAVRDGEGGIMMEGPAVLNDGRWDYIATAAIAVGEAVTIEAVATDRPGHTGSRTAPLVIA